MRSLFRMAFKIYGFCQSSFSRWLLPRFQLKNQPKLSCEDRWCCFLRLRPPDWSEDKHIRNPVSFDPANLDVWKIYQRNLQSLYRFVELFLDTFAVISQKKQTEIFPSDGNAVLSIFLKYQEMYLRLTTTETFRIPILLHTTNRRCADYKYWSDRQFFVNDPKGFRYRNETMNDTAKIRLNLR